MTKRELIKMICDMIDAHNESIVKGYLLSIFPNLNVVDCAEVLPTLKVQQLKKLFLTLKIK